MSCPATWHNYSSTVMYPDLYQTISQIPPVYYQDWQPQASSVYYPNHYPVSSILLRRLAGHFQHITLTIIQSSSAPILRILPKPLPVHIVCRFARLLSDYKPPSAYQIDRCQIIQTRGYPDYHQAIGLHNILPKSLPDHIDSRLPRLPSNGRSPSSYQIDHCQTIQTAGYLDYHQTVGHHQHIRQIITRPYRLQVTQTTIRRQATISILDKSLMSQPSPAYWFPWPISMWLLLAPDPGYQTVQNISHYPHKARAWAFTLCVSGFTAVYKISSCLTTTILQ